MDLVLYALKHYRQTASPQKKAVDLARLEKECLSTVDANQYIYAVTVQSKRATKQKELINYNLNPDYHLDFSLSDISYANSCCICF